MSTKAISEYDGKCLLAKWLKRVHASNKCVQISENTDWEKIQSEHPWMLSQPLVVKPDQLIKRRGKSGLILVNAKLEQVQQWIHERMGKEVEVSGIKGVLRQFIVEPYIAHSPKDEYYVCIHSVAEGEEMLFYHEGGVDVGDVDTKSSKYLIPIGQIPTEEVIETHLLSHVIYERRTGLAKFLQELFRVYEELFFSYLEINPLVMVDHQIYCLDMAAKLDQTAHFECGAKWGTLEFPVPFGRDSTPEERYIADLDSKTGASLKLTILNPHGRVWTMVAGGGASVAYADAIANLEYAHELANYGEYSGAPNESETYEYAKTILDLMTREPHANGKILIIGGGIANFTNVAATFKGIVRAMEEFQHKLVEQHVRTFVRRGGPNYQEGLRLMKHLGDKLGIPIHVYGPEIHVTAVVPIALGTVDSDACHLLSMDHIDRFNVTENVFGELSGTKRAKSFSTVSNAFASTSLSSPSTSSPTSPLLIANGNAMNGKPEGLLTTSNGTGNLVSLQEKEETARAFSAKKTSNELEICHFPHTKTLLSNARPWYELFTPTTRTFIYGMQPRAVQGMLDFDYLCKRTVPSVAAMIYPFGGDHVQKFYWGTNETLLPVFQTVEEAVKKFPEVDSIVNFASFRSVYESTLNFLNHSQFRTIAIIAEGVPEKRAKQLRKAARDKHVTIIGPATVGGIKPGCFKVGNTGGAMDNIIASRLYRRGSVGYVSKSGGMSNELNNIISLTTNGVYEGIAIGGDRFPGSSFLDHLLRYEADPECKILLLLGEVGGVEEYQVIEALQAGKLCKPLISWCIGTCTKMFTTEVQFGHAGAYADSERETADAKNRALRNAGALVPDSFEDLPRLLKLVYEQLIQSQMIIPQPEPETPRVPIDYAWATELGLIRKPAHFVSTICDDRGQELLYAGMPISDVFKEDIGIGGVVSLLWFRRRLPDYAAKFIDIVLMLTADHGPAVSGAHNTIVTARAGKDLISSLCSGLLTIGDRFGGALDGAAQQFARAYDEGLSPSEFVDSMRRKHELILGIGHKIKSKHNPDLRVKIIIDYALAHFPSTPLLHYAMQVEKLTTAKKDNLILNVDGAVAVAFVDLLHHSGAFTREECEDYIRIGVLNGLFVLGRTIGFIGHFIDQRRLNQGLYRHPWDDISYITVPHGV